MSLFNEMLVPGAGRSASRFIPLVGILAYGPVLVVLGCAGLMPWSAVQIILGLIMSPTLVYALDKLKRGENGASEPTPDVN